MTLNDIISEAQRIRESMYDENDITGFINEVEQRVADEVIGKYKDIEWKPYTYEDNADTELLIPEQYKEVYLTYIFAKTDYYNAETDRYALDMQMHNAAWKTYAATERRNNRPRRFKWNYHT